MHWCVCHSVPANKTAGTPPAFSAGQPLLTANPACPSSCLQAARCDQAAIEEALMQAFEAADLEIVKEAVAK